VEIISRRPAPKRAAVLAFPGAEGIVANRGDGIRFHQWDMLEGGSVINRLRAIALKNLRHQRAVQNISENGCVSGFARRRKLPIDFVEILFGMVEENQEARVAGSERLHKSGPNRTSCSCD